jgi:hypothetical protein
MEILERAEGSQRYSESLTGRHSLARLRVLQCCSDPEGEGGPVGSWRAARKRNPARPGSSRPSTGADRCAKAATSVHDRFGDQAYAECFWQ